MRQRLALPFVLAIAHLCPSFVADSSAQTVNWFTFEPLVVPATFTQSVLIEAAGNGSPTRVTLDLNGGGTLELRDDGTGGDRQAHDGVYTASLDGAALIRALQQAHRVVGAMGWRADGELENPRGMAAPANAYERRLCRLAFLAPDIQKQIMAGWQLPRERAQRLPGQSCSSSVL